MTSTEEMLADMDQWRRDNNLGPSYPALRDALRSDADDQHTPAVPKDLLTTTEAAPEVGLRANTLRGYRTSGPKFTRVSGRVYYSKTDLLEWQANRGTADQEGASTESELPWEEMAALADQLAALLGRKFR